jgi:hypothetical protein
MSNRIYKVYDANSADGSASATYIRTSAAGEGEGGDGGDGVTPPLWKLDVKRDVQIAKYGLAGLLTLFGLFYWFSYLGDIKDIRTAIAAIDTNVAVQAKTLGDMQQSLDRIESRLDTRDDNHPQASQGAGQAGAVHSGTRGGGKPNG